MEPGHLMASMMVSAVGFGILVYARRERRAPQLLAGVALLVLSVVGLSPAWAIIGGMLRLGA